MTKTNRVYISDILKAISLIEQFSHDKSVVDLATDLMFQSATVHQLEIIGEAASKINSDIKDRYPQIPWRAMINTRNRIIHDYDNVDIDIVWEILQKDLPPLKTALFRIEADIC